MLSISRLMPDETATWDGAGQFCREAAQLPANSAEVYQMGVFVGEFISIKTT